MMGKWIWEWKEESNRNDVLTIRFVDKFGISPEFIHCPGTCRVQHSVQSITNRKRRQTTAAT